MLLQDPSLRSDDGELDPESRLFTTKNRQRLAAGAGRDQRIQLWDTQNFYALLESEKLEIIWFGMGFYDQI